MIPHNRLERICFSEFPKCCYMNGRKIPESFPKLYKESMILLEANHMFS